MTPGLRDIIDALARTSDDDAARTIAALAIELSATRELLSHALGLLHDQRLEIARLERRVVAQTTELRTLLGLPTYEDSDDQTEDD